LGPNRKAEVVLSFHILGAANNPGPKGFMDTDRSDTEELNTTHQPVVEDDVIIEEIDDDNNDLGNNNDNDDNSDNSNNDNADDSEYYRRASLIFRTAVESLRRARSNLSSPFQNTNFRRHSGDANYNLSGSARDHNYLGNVMSIRSNSGILSPSEEKTEKKDDYTSGSDDDNDDNDDIQMIPILPINVILFPHETLPLRLHQNAMIRHTKSAIEKAETGDMNATQIGVFPLKPSLFGDWKSLDRCCGTLANFDSIVEDSNTDELIVTARGSRRFKIISLPHMVSGVYFCQVHLLNDSHLPIVDPLKLSKSAAIPLSVVEFHSPYHLAVTAHDILRDNANLYEGIVANLPKLRRDNVEFFIFWLASNIPSSTRERFNLLSSPSILGIVKTIVENLRGEIEKGGKSERWFCCSRCHNPFSKKGEIFAVPGANGTSGQYVNPHGAVHTTLTFRSVSPDSIILEHALPTTTDSWFPRYAWTIAYCSRCYGHLGWLFTNVAGDDGVKEFYGISASGVLEMDVMNDDGDGDDDDDDDDNDDDDEAEAAYNYDTDDESGGIDVDVEDDVDDLIAHDID